MILEIDAHGIYQEKIITASEIIDKILFLTMPQETFDILSLIAQSERSIELSRAESCDQSSFNAFLIELKINGISTEKYHMSENASTSTHSEEKFNEHPSQRFSKPQDTTVMKEDTFSIFIVDETTSLENINLEPIDYFYVTGSLSIETIKRLSVLVEDSERDIVLSSLISPKLAKAIKEQCHNDGDTIILGFEQLDLKDDTPWDICLNRLQACGNALFEMPFVAMDAKQSDSSDNIYRLLTELNYWLYELCSPTEKRAANNHFTMSLNLNAMIRLSHRTEHDNAVRQHLQEIQANRHLPTTPTEPPPIFDSLFYYVESMAQVENILRIKAGKDPAYYILLAPYLNPKEGLSLQKEFPAIGGRKILYGFEENAQQEDFIAPLQFLRNKHVCQKYGITRETAQYYGAVLNFWQAMSIQDHSKKFVLLNKCGESANTLKDAIEHAKHFLNSVKKELRALTSPRKKMKIDDNDHDSCNPATFKTYDSFEKAENDLFGITLLGKKGCYYSLNIPILLVINFVEIPSLEHKEKLLDTFLQRSKLVYTGDAESTHTFALVFNNKQDRDTYLWVHFRHELSPADTLILGISHREAFLSKLSRENKENKDLDSAQDTEERIQSISSKYLSPA